MSVLHWGDDDMHYSDSSHRWIAPENMEQSLWEAGLRAHLAQHLATMGGPVRHDEQRARWTAKRAAKAGGPVRTTRVTRRVLRLVPDEHGTQAPEHGEQPAA
jgi:hypothetical protein